MRLTFVCSTCGETLDVEQERDTIYYGDRHDCWGDRATIVAMFSRGRIWVTDDRVDIQIEVDNSGNAE